MASDNYSLMRGGLVHRVLRSLGLTRRGRHLTRWLALLAVTVAAAPLVLMTAADGTLLPGVSAVRMPLLGDYAMITRLFLALPVLVLAAPVCDGLLSQALVQFSRSGMVHPVQRQAFDAVLAHMQRMRDSVLPELLCLLVALAPAVLHAAPLGMVHGDISDWSHAGAALTPAGRWFVLVSTSIFRFVGLLWAWRFLLWSWLLWRFSRIDLDLRAAHPDGAGGLGFLGVIQQRFSVLAFAGGVLVAGYCINQMTYLGETLHDLRFLLLGYVIAATAAITLPLLVMTPRLLKTKREGLLLYGLLGHDAVHTFDRRWLGPGERKAGTGQLIDAGDSSAVCDFTSVFATVRGMAVVPISRWHLLWIALSAALPLGPLVFFALSVDEVLGRLAQILV